MIGTCECCDRTDVPISHIDTVFGIEAFACFICLGETDPDPYGELQPDDDCDSPFDFPNDSDPFTLVDQNNYSTLADRLRDCYFGRELPTWGDIHDAADAIDHLMTINDLMAPGISAWKERAEHAEAVLAEQDSIAQEWVDEYTSLRDRFTNFLVEFKKSAASVNLLCGPRPGGKTQDWLDGQDRGLRQGLHIAETIVKALLEYEAIANAASPISSAHHSPAANKGD